MLRLQTDSLGTVRLSFRHFLPSISVEINNRLSSSKVVKTQGRTSCRIQLPAQGLDEYYEGFAYTHPDDPYTKKTGRNLSFLRAIEQIPELTEDAALELSDSLFATVNV